MNPLTKLPGTRGFFQYARARHAVYIDKEVQKRPWPWTADKILQTYRFCNVFRELDRTTLWFREHLRHPLRERELVLHATVAFRWFNKIETFQTLASGYEGAGLVELMENWDSATVSEVLRRDGKAPWTTGAYIIITPAGMDKIAGVLWCIENMAKHYPSILVHMQGEGLEYAWELLRQEKFMGDFMAYEVVTDLRHTALLRDAEDKMTWANPGPGACRGMARVLAQPVDTYNRNKKEHRTEVILNMRLLLELANGNSALWPTTWQRWEMREVEHTLCEFDKYERARLGEGKPKQLYRRAPDARS